MAPGSAAERNACGERIGSRVERGAQKSGRQLRTWRHCLLTLLLWLDLFSVLSSKACIFFFFQKKQSNQSSLLPIFTPPPHKACPLQLCFSIVHFTHYRLSLAVRSLHVRIIGKSFGASKRKSNSCQLGSQGVRRPCATASSIATSFATSTASTFVLPT